MRLKSVDIVPFHVVKRGAIFLDLPLETELQAYRDNLLHFILLLAFEFGNLGFNPPFFVHGVLAPDQDHFILAVGRDLHDVLVGKINLPFTFLARPDARQRRLVFVVLLVIRPCGQSGQDHTGQQGDGSEEFSQHHV